MMSNLISLSKATLHPECNTNRPASVPPPTDGSTRMSPKVFQGLNDIRSASISPSMMYKHSASSSLGNVHGFRTVSNSIDRERGVAPLDLMDVLQRSEPAVVKSRTGSVLSRGMILKTDHYPSGAYFACQMKSYVIDSTIGRALDLDLNVHGAPNFRSSRQGSLNVFGAAQPRTQGLRAILSILRARPNIPSPTHVVWFSTREEPMSGCFAFMLKDQRVRANLNHSIHLWTPVCSSRCLRTAPYARPLRSS